MKRFLLFSLLCLFINTYGQDTYTGKIIMMPNPCICPPEVPDCTCLPGLVIGLETTFGKYVLTVDSRWFWDGLVLNGTEYLVDDEVEITGTLSGKKGSSGNYIVLEIGTIKKLSTNLESLLSDKNKVYYDDINQAIVIDEVLQNKSTTVELVDLQGNTLLKKINTSESISIANLPNGVYLCRILQNGRVIYSDKILKR